MIALALLLLAAGPKGHPKMQDVSLLADRFVISMPKGARVEARQKSIMSAPEPEANETRVVFDDGAERLVLMANDLFAISGEDLVADSRAEMANWEERKNDTLASLAVAEGVRAASFLPAEPECGGDACFLGGAFVAGKDGAVVQITLYVNPKGIEARAAHWTAQAKRILASVKAGKGKPLSRAAGKRVLATYDGKRNVSVDLPADWAVSQQRGPDFDVVRVFPMRRLGGDAGSLGIYLGHHPSFRPDPKAAKREGTIFGKAVSWQKNDATNGASFDALVPPDGERSPVMHVFVWAPDEKRAIELVDLAKKLSLD